MPKSTPEKRKCVPKRIQEVTFDVPNNRDIPPCNDVDLSVADCEVLEEKMAKIRKKGTFASGDEALEPVCGDMKCGDKELILCSGNTSINLPEKMM